MAGLMGSLGSLMDVGRLHNLRGGLMRRLFRVLKWIVLSVLALIGIVLIVTATRCAIASARLEKKIVALRAAGQPVSLVDLASKPVG